MKGLAAGVAVGVFVGWVTAPFIASLINPQHPDESASYWTRVGNSWWWRVRFSPR